MGFYLLCLQMKGLERCSYFAASLLNKFPRNPQAKDILLNLSFVSLCQNALYLSRERCMVEIIFKRMPLALTYAITLVHSQFFMHLLDTLIFYLINEKKIKLLFTHLKATETS
jgi:hypothetical protein